ncbi:MAG TPA: putative glycoside hydrolase, partial [Herpetosiphonaceae bacterium]|nr:putative glycoside hydrolase [Herpetosiphonaceae bacterium]
MGKYADYVYPMVYPSHFLYGELGLGNPSLHPYEIVGESMRLVKNQMQGEASRAKVRPWLQDFTLIWVPENQIVRYGPKEVRAQIDGAEANGVNGWALWDSDNDYTVGALKGPE